MALLPLAWRPHLSTILRTPASRKIFLFLCVNLAYMGVQMAYGVITNSLGLISDGELNRTELGTLTLYQLFICSLTVLVLLSASGHQLPPLGSPTDSTHSVTRVWRR